MITVRRMLSGCVLAVVAVTVSAELASCASRALQVAAATDTSTSPATRLWAVAASTATANGGKVLRAEAVRSTHALAVKKIMQTEVSGEQDVWVVQVEGAQLFRCITCSVPAGAGVPRGRYVTVVVDAKTFERLDFGIGPAKADLGRLGRVIALHG